MSETEIEIDNRQQVAVEAHELSFEFHGIGSEYFRIWIVNLLLSILTLGIYSAWAKVRREQYFHRNLLLDGAGFDYHATPRAILIGRCIGLLLLLAVSFAQNAGPIPYLLVMLAAAGIAPWLILRALRFRARNTSYRGLRFSFAGDYGGALGAFVGYWLLTIVTMGILAPLWIREMRLYVMRNLRYGNARFSCTVAAKPFFRVILLPVLAALGAFVLVALLTVVLGKRGRALVPLLTFSMFFVYLAALAYVRMGLTNLVWSNTKLGEHSFHSEMRFTPYLGLVAMNWLLIVVTLGIYWPWAKVRLAAYRARCTGITVAGGLDGFIAAAGEDVAAFGEEAAEMFDIDIAL